MKTIKIGIGHVIRALQKQGFGHDEIMAFKEAMITNDFSKIRFIADCYTSDWDIKEQLRLSHS